MEFCSIWRWTNLLVGTIITSDILIGNHLIHLMFIGIDITFGTIGTFNYPFDWGLSWNRWNRWNYGWGYWNHWNRPFYHWDSWYNGPTQPII